MKVIILIRHAQSTMNALGIPTGQKDVCLSDLGKEQAEITGKYLACKIKKIDCMWCSTLNRTKETAEIISKEIGYKGDIKQFKQLVEYGKGELEGSAEKNEEFKQIMKEHDEKYKNDPIGWFTVHQKMERVDIPKRFKQENYKKYCNRLEYMIQHMENTKCKKLIIVSHGRTISSLIKYIFGLNWSVTGKGKEPMGNCSITYLTYDKGEWTLVVPMSTSHLDR